jgi:hypothetical protein
MASNAFITPARKTGRFFVEWLLASPGLLPGKTEVRSRRLESSSFDWRSLVRRSRTVFMASIPTILSCASLPASPPGQFGCQKMHTAPFFPHFSPDAIFPCSARAGSTALTVMTGTPASKMRTTVSIRYPAPKKNVELGTGSRRVKKRRAGSTRPFSLHETAADFTDRFFVLPIL